MIKTCRWRQWPPTRLCSTPTAAANLLTQSWQEIPRALDRYAAISFQGYKNALTRKNLQLKEYAAILANFKFILQKINRQIQDTAQMAMVKIENSLAAAAEKIAHLQELIDARDPARQLRLGYCIAKINGVIVKRAGDAKVGDEMDIVLSDGIINSKINRIYGREKEN